MRVEVANKTKKRIEIPFVSGIVKKTLGSSGKKPENFSVSVVFVGRSEIRRLNRVYRKKYKATDVLSFIYNSGYNKTEGELFLCPEVIEKSARENKVSFQKELAFVLSHGVLHLLGFRHGKKMFVIQDEVSTNYESIRMNEKFVCDKDAKLK